MTIVAVACAACEKSDFAPLYAATIQNADDAPESYFSSSRARAGYLSIVRCRSCGLVMQNPRDDAETLARVYGALADGVYEQEDANRLASAHEHLALVERHCKPSGNLLDIGCATGLFVEVARAAGFRVSGADASAWMVERARARCPGTRFEVGTIETLDFAAESFDAVTLFDVIEHVDAPHATLSRVRRWLRPGGWLFLSVPNSASFTARALGRRWVLLLREHLWYFSPDTIGKLLGRSGYELVDTRTKWVAFSLSNVAGRLGQYPGVLGRAAARLSGNAVLQHVPLRFPMGEMDVVARSASSPAQ
jgi:2-polyprenyl-3-methyl-5-hydroxy-6-metoxy-1,4-benzoquinol methylase